MGPARPRHARRRDAVPDLGYRDREQQLTRTCRPQADRTVADSRFVRNGAGAPAANTGGADVARAKFSPAEYWLRRQSFPCCASSNCLENSNLRWPQIPATERQAI